MCHIGKIICRDIIYSIINELPLSNQIDINIVDNMCPICLEPGDTTGLCNCNSTYHIDCWNEWFVNHTTCPTCRT